MFTNFQKAIANRMIHSNPRGIILRSPFLRSSPIDFPDYEDNITNVLMANYRHHRLDETLQYFSDALKQNGEWTESLDSGKSILNLLQKYRSDLPKHFRAQTISIINYNQVNPKSLPIEPVTNLLYLIASFNSRNPAIEAALIERLKEKDLNDATISNIGDLLFYFQITPDAAGNHKVFVQAVKERAKFLIATGCSTVKENGSTVNVYEATEYGSYSTLEKGLVECLNSKGKSNSSVHFTFKYLIPLKNAFYSLYSKKLIRNAWLYETSLLYEFDRIRALLEENTPAK